MREKREEFAKAKNGLRFLFSFFAAKARNSLFINFKIVNLKLESDSLKTC